MALIKCIECNNEMSSEASHCPKCGYPNRIYQNQSNINANVNMTVEKDSTLNSNCVWAIVGFVISLLGLFFFNLYGITGIAGFMLSFYGLGKLNNKNVVCKILAILGMIIGVVDIIFGIIAIINLFYLSNMVNNYLP